MNDLTPLRHLPQVYLTDGEFQYFWQGSTHSCASKLKRLVAQGKLLSIRRGLYCLTAAMGYAQKPHPFELAQLIQGPSYISFESALAFYHLIPEAVHTTTSATLKRSKIFETPLGVFTYAHLPPENFYLEVTRQDSFFIATPWRALCDFVYFYKKTWKNLEALEKDLRLATEHLPPLSSDTAQALREYYHHRRVNRFLKGVLK